MDRVKTLVFRIADRLELVFLHVSMYEFGMGLAIELYCCDGMPYARLTVNLTDAPFKLQPNEAFINTNIAGKEILTFIRENRLGTLVPGKVYKYFPVVAFDWDRLREFDYLGVEKVIATRNESGF